jgi:myo-inositol-1(or 4)-monophosphatase
MNRPRSEYGEYLEFAIKLAEQAGEILMKGFGSKGHEIKHDGSYVTKTDLESEKLIIDAIRKAYPDHDILSEEDNDKKSKSDFLWIIDPLDGTHNFIFGIPFFGVIISLVHKDRVVAGAIRTPVFKHTCWAERGCGAFMNGEKISVSRRKGKNSIFTFESPQLQSDEYFKKQFPVISEMMHDFRYFCASCIDFSYISSGVIDALMSSSLKPWDIAAGCLIVEEAGGKVTDFSGNPWNPWIKQVVASNGLVHEDILKALNSK